MRLGDAHVDSQRAAHVDIQRDDHFVHADLADRRIDGEVLAVDDHMELPLHGLHDVGGSDRAEEFPACSGLRVMTSGSAANIAAIARADSLSAASRRSRDFFCDSACATAPSVASTARPLGMR